ncbi:NAD(P)H-binding protein [Tsukamurella soli]|uniref:NAD(P)H-binding protein n=1 Tax=Tsukamurella soli TaxID=644556 RepID=A0ABP8J7W4_9ACTN
MRVLVTGATGTVGRTVIRGLTGAGAEVRAVSRRGAGDLAVADVVPEWEAGVDGVDAIFVHPRAVGLDAGRLVARAEAAGVRRLVVMSAVNVDTPDHLQPSRVRGDRNREVEAAVVASALPSTVLRCDVFASNTFGTVGAQLRRSDVVRGAFPRVAERLIDERDIGDVAVAALLDPRWAGRRLELTGPEALTLPRVVDVVGAVTGRHLSFEEVPRAVAAAALVAAGLPKDFADSYFAMLAEQGDRYSTPSGDVAAVLGHPARDYAGWVADHREVFAA